MKLLAIPGSLRSASINAAFCRVAARLAPPAFEVRVFTGLADLPLFNPDLEPTPPAAVTGLRAEVAQADLLLIASPEYAHGVAGPMKNALDWLVSFEGTVGKAVALVNTSPRAHHAYESLREILRTMSTRLVAEAAIPLLGACTTEEAMMESAPVRSAARDMFEAIAVQGAGARASGPSFPLA